MPFELCKGMVSGQQCLLVLDSSKMILLVEPGLPPLLMHHPSQLWVPTLPGKLRLRHSKNHSAQHFQGGLQLACHFRGGANLQRGATLLLLPSDAMGSLWETFWEAVLKLLVLPLVAPHLAVLKLAALKLKWPANSLAWELVEKL